MAGSSVTLGPKGGIRVRIRVDGQDKLVKNLKGLSDGLIQAVGGAITVAALNIDAGAKGACLVDTGRLRSSIRPTFVKGGLAASVGTNVKYAKFIEFGTGPLGASTHSGQLPAGYVHGPAYFPNPTALAPWARRHGAPGAEYAIALAIYRRGGTRAMPFLGPAFEAEKPALLDRLREALKGQTKKAGGR
jgi:HK97 gp10 family phage protein